MIPLGWMVAHGDDLVRINGGGGNDTITYNVSPKGTTRFSLMAEQDTTR